MSFFYLQNPWKAASKKCIPLTPGILYALASIHAPRIMVFPIRHGRLAPGRHRCTLSADESPDDARGTPSNRFTNTFLMVPDFNSSPTTGPIRKGA